MISFLKLIRIQNLLIIAFTQYMVRYCLILPIFRVRGLELQLPDLYFFLLVLSTVMIAAAGYIINDYFDVRIDKVNKPERLVIDKGVKRRVAMGAHMVINILAIGISLFISWKIGAWKLAILHFICASGLWFYSTTFKRQFLIGNLIIAAFTAMVPLVTGIYELLPAIRVYGGVSFRDVWFYVLAVSFFAFITTLLREIIKDIEDYEGDKAYGCRTMPIVWGIRASKHVAVLISVATMTCLGYLQSFFWKGDNMPAFWYFVFALQLPFLFLVWKTYTAESKRDLRFAGNTAKLIMLAGVCYLFLFSHFILTSIHVIR